MVIRWMLNRHINDCNHIYSTSQNIPSPAGRKTGEGGQNWQFFKFQEDPGTSIPSISSGFSLWLGLQNVATFLPRSPSQNLSGIPHGPNKARSLRCKLIETDSFPETWCLEVSKATKTGTWGFCLLTLINFELLEFQRCGGENRFGGDKSSWVALWKKEL